MKYKQTRVCGTCRAHKIGCDGKRPSCSQCLHTGRKCAGYRSNAEFVPYTPKSPTKTPRAPPAKAPAARLTKAGSSPIVHSRTITNALCYPMAKSVGATTVEDFAAVILNCYIPVNHQACSISDTSTTQVCGAWVNILPTLVHKAHSSKLVTSAVRTLGSAILERTPDGNRIAFQNVEAYNSTLYHLKDALLSPEQVFLETAAAISCLAMSELLFSTSQDAFGAHLTGLGALIESHKPEKFSSDVFHAIFVGSRPLLIFHAIFTRKSTFLAQNDWKSVPFCHRPPSDMQSILGDVASLPSILEEIDLLRINFDGATPIRALKLKVDVLNILDFLSTWKDRFEMATTYLPSPPHSEQDSDHSDDPEQMFWFPNLLAANINVHVWAFELICLSEMEKLDSFLREHGCCTELEDDSFGERDIQTRTVELAAKICRSIEYLIQDEMRLHGPASAIFPLQIAFETLSKNQRANAACIQRCSEFFKRIRHRGYQARLPL